MISKRKNLTSPYKIEKLGSFSFFLFPFVNHFPIFFKSELSIIECEYPSFPTRTIALPNRAEVILLPSLFSFIFMYSLY